MATCAVPRVSCVARSSEASPVRVGEGEGVTRGTVAIALGDLVAGSPGESDSDGSREGAGAWIVGGAEKQAVNNRLKRRGHEPLVRRALSVVEGLIAVS